MTTMKWGVNQLQDSFLEVGNSLKSQNNDCAECLSMQIILNI